MNRKNELELIIDGLDSNIDSFERKARKCSTATDKLFYDTKAQLLRKQKRVFNQELFAITDKTN